MLTSTFISAGLFSSIPSALCITKKCNCDACILMTCMSSNLHKQFCDFASKYNLFKIKFY